MELTDDLPDDKPVSVPPFQEAVVIRLGWTLLPSSSNLPGSLTERAAPSPLFGLAPHGVFTAIRITPNAVRSYRTFSPLPLTLVSRLTKSNGGIFSVALSVALAFPREPPAVNRHAALWRPDFPPAEASDYLSGKPLLPI